MTKNTRKRSRKRRRRRRKRTGRIARDPRCQRHSRASVVSVPWRATLSAQNAPSIQRENVSTVAKCVTSAYL
jgi:hypothetical protein